MFPGVSSAYTVKHSPKTIKALKRADAEYIAEHGPINNTYDLAIKEAIAASLPKPVNRTPEMMARILKGIPIVQAVNFSPVISDASNIISPSNTLPRSTMQKGTTKKDNPQKDTPLIPPKISPPKNTMPKHTPAKETLKRHNLPKNTSPKETLLKNTQQWNTPTFISPPKMALPLRKKVEAPMAPAYSPEAQPFMSFDLGKEIHTPPFPNGKKPRPVTTGKLKTGNRLAGAVSPATVPRVVSKAPRYPSKDFVAGEGQNTAVNTPTAPAFKKRGTGGAPAMRAANAKRQRVRSPVVSDLLPATNFTKKKNMNAK